MNAKLVLPVALVKMPHAFDVPLYATPGSSGADLYAAEDRTILAGRFEVIPTGIRIAMIDSTGDPQIGQWECQIRSRSGLAAKQGLFVLNSPGTCDLDYIGELKVILMNLDTIDHTIKRGDRIAQIVFTQVTQASFLLYDEAEFETHFATERGSGGFGSTGK